MYAPRPAVVHKVHWDCTDPYKPKHPSFKNDPYACHYLGDERHASGLNKRVFQRTTIRAGLIYKGAPSAIVSAVVFISAIQNPVGSHPQLNYFNICLCSQHYTTFVHIHHLLIFKTEKSKPIFIHCTYNSNSSRSIKLE